MSIDNVKLWVVWGREGNSKEKLTLHSQEVLGLVNNRADVFMNKEDAERLAVLYEEASKNNKFDVVALTRENQE